MADLSELEIVATVDEIEDDFIATAQAAELPATSWVEGSTYLVLGYALADALADVSLTVAKIAVNALIGRALGAWVDRVLKSQYDEDRTKPVFTVGQVTLVDHGGGPHAITNGEFLVGTNGGLQFRVLLGGGTLAKDGTLDVIVRAVAAGGLYNVANNAIAKLITAAPTVTVSNPAVGSTGTWITTLGADLESDEAAKKRGPLKWGILSTGSPPSAYEFWARSTTGVTRASVDDENPLGPNTVGVYVDNPGSVATLQTTLDEKAPSGTKPSAIAATVVNVTIPAVVSTRRGFAARVATQNELDLTALSNSIDIGGLVIQAEIIERIMSAPGAVDVAFTSAWTGSPNVQLGPGEIPQFTLALTYMETT